MGSGGQKGVDFGAGMMETKTVEFKVEMEFQAEMGQKKEV